MGDIGAPGPTGAGRPVALVTGASRGIGRACAIALAGAGHDIGIGFFQNVAAAGEVAKVVQKIGGRTVLLQGDVRVSADCERLVERVAEQFGRIDVVVSNATGLSSGDGERPPEHRLGQPVVATSYSVFAEMLDARLCALHALTRAAVPRMGPGGSLIAITSNGARRYVDGYAPVGVAMAAVESLVRYLAAELGPQGITVNAVSGGVVNTDALHEITTDVEGLVRRAARATPLGRIAEPADIANIVSALASPQCAWITGQTLVADGGASLR
jgi:NAD(P)-dependent dehydrogenase (short-subunit alcohol dehydrogenase family)